LLNLRGLDNIIATTDFGIDVWENAALESLEGLDHVTKIGGDLNIFKNAALTSLKGLEGLESVGGNLFIQSNANLPAAAVDDLVKRITVGGSVTVSDNMP